MPNRLIKESICTSEEIDKLTNFQEIFFYRLIVNCDDYGRMDARAKILKSKLFPLRDVRTDQIEAALNALASVKLVILYESDGKPFLQMRTWSKHQQVRAKESKYPSPEGKCCGKIAFDSNGYQLISDDSICPRNPIQSNTESEFNPMRGNTPAREEDAGFEKFWAAYPRKSGDIRSAFQAWLQAMKEGATPEIILDALQWQAEEWKREGEARFIPSPEKWLTNKRWQEEERGATKQSVTFSDVYYGRQAT